MALATSSTAPIGSDPSGKALSLGSPSFAAVVIAAIAGLGMIAFAGYLIAATSASAPLIIAIAIVGVAEATCAYFTFRLVRVAWAFSLSINGTAAVVLLFSAPRIRDAAEVSIAMALLPCIVAGTIVLLHALKPEDF